MEVDWVLWTGDELTPEEAHFMGSSMDEL